MASVAGAATKLVKKRHPIRNAGIALGIVGAAGIGVTVAATRKTKKWLYDALNVTSLEQSIAKFILPEGSNPNELDYGPMAQQAAKSAQANNGMEL